MTPVPAYQLCTDCKTNKRALAIGLTGYGCLCVKCYETRMDEARKKKPPKPKPAGKAKYNWALGQEMLQLTPEQRCARDYCGGCELCNYGQLKDEVDNLDKL
jgi:hypothetical protein